MEFDDEPRFRTEYEYTCESGVQPSSAAALEQQQQISSSEPLVSSGQSSPESLELSGSETSPMAEDKSRLAHSPGRLFKSMARPAHLQYVPLRQTPRAMDTSISNLPKAREADKSLQNKQRKVRNAAFEQMWTRVEQEAQARGRWVEVTAAMNTLTAPQKKYGMVTPTEPTRDRNTFPVRPLSARKLSVRSVSGSRGLNAIVENERGSAGLDKDEADGSVEAIHGKQLLRASGISSAARNRRPSTAGARIAQGIAMLDSKGRSSAGGVRYAANLFSSPYLGIPNLKNPLNLALDGHGGGGKRPQSASARVEAAETTLAGKSSSRHASVVDEFRRSATQKDRQRAHSARIRQDKLDPTLSGKGASGEQKMGVKPEEGDQGGTAPDMQILDQDDTIQTRDSPQPLTEVEVRAISTHGKGIEAESAGHAGCDAQQEVGEYVGGVTVQDDDDDETDRAFVSCDSAAAITNVPDALETPNERGGPAGSKWGLVKRKFRETSGTAGASASHAKLDEPGSKFQSSVVDLLSKLSHAHKKHQSFLAAQDSQAGATQHSHSFRRPQSPTGSMRSRFDRASSHASSHSRHPMQSRRGLDTFLPYGAAITRSGSRSSVTEESSEQRAHRLGLAATAEHLTAVLECVFQHMAASELAEEGVSSSSATANTMSIAEFTDFLSQLCLNSTDAMSVSDLARKIFRGVTASRKELDRDAGADANELCFAEFLKCVRQVAAEVHTSVADLILPLLPQLAGRASNQIVTMSSQSHTLARASVQLMLDAQTACEQELGRVMCWLQEAVQHLIVCDEARVYVVREGGGQVCTWVKRKVAPAASAVKASLTNEEENEVKTDFRSQHNVSQSSMY